MTGSPTRGGARMLRAAVLGAASMVLATGAHRLGGGALPPLAALVLVGLVVGLVAVTLTARRCRLPLLLAVLGVEQLGLHLLFSALASATPVSADCASAGVHEAMTAACRPTTGLVTSGSGAMAPMGWLMLLGHLAAVLGTAWLLARGEAWLWRVGEQLVDAASAGPRGWPECPRSSVAAVPVRFRLDQSSYAPAGPRGPPTG